MKYDGVTDLKMHTSKHAGSELRHCHSFKVKQFRRYPMKFGNSVDYRDAPCGENPKRTVTIGKSATCGRRGLAQFNTRIMLVTQ